MELHSNSERALEILRRPLEARTAGNLTASLEAFDLTVRASIRGLAPDALKARSLTLFLRRIAASNSLTLAVHSPLVSPLENWQNANILVNEWVAAGQLITWTRISQLHCVLSGGSDFSPELRLSPCQGGNCEYPPPQDLPALQHVFQSEVLERLEQDHALIEASRLYQWLISLHFFEDGNGRLARLVADWRLARGGYPPLTFDSDVASFICVLDTKRSLTPQVAFERTRQSVENSIAILTGQAE